MIFFFLFQDLFPYVIQTNSRLYDLWDAAMSIIFSLNLFQPVLIHDTSYVGLSLSHIATQDQSHDTLQLSLNADMSKAKFDSELSFLLNTDKRFALISGTSEFVTQTLKYAKVLGMLDGEFIWLLMDMDLKKISREALVPGLLNIHPRSKPLAEAFLRSSLAVILKSLKTGVKRSVKDLLPPFNANCLVPSSNNSHNMSQEMNNYFT